MNPNKIADAVCKAIDGRPHVDGTSYVLCWAEDKIVCIHHSALRCPKIPIINLSECECEMGIGNKKRIKTITRTMHIITEQGKESDYE